MSAKILLVEDDGLLQDVLLRRLPRAGYEVVGVSDGAAALVAAAEQQPDLILLDVRLPVMDGVEVARKLRKMPAFSHTPIIALSANEPDAANLNNTPPLFDSYLTKPVPFSTLVALLESYLPGDKT